MFDNVETNDTPLIGLLDAIRILNDKRLDPSELDKALVRIQGAVERVQPNDEEAKG